MTPNIEFISQRALLLKELREFFDSRGFLEVQPPCLAADCVVDTHLDPICVESKQLRLGSVNLPAEMMLQTSPESAMKRMLAAGAPSIYSIGPVFRAGEQGDLHNIEFTMLEWYEVGGDIDSGIQLLGDLAIHTLGHQTFGVRTYHEVFCEALQIEPTAPIEQLRLKCAGPEAGLVDSIDDDRDTLLDVLMSSYVQPTLGHDRPVIVKNYPITQAALARESAEDSQCSARFELFACGMELANGYDELTDPNVFLQRAEQHNLRRTSSGRPALLAESKLYYSMRDERLPPCAGVALGVDRLLMLRVGADSIDQVIPLTIDRA